MNTLNNKILKSLQQTKALKQVNILLVLLCTLTTIAQETDTIKTPKSIEAYVNYSVSLKDPCHNLFNKNAPTTAITNFHSLAPNSAYLKNDLRNYKSTTVKKNGSHVNDQMKSIGMGHDILNRSGKIKQHVSIGIMYTSASTTNFSAGYYRINNHSNNTLNFENDSTVKERIDMWYKSSEFRIASEFVIRYNTENTWSFYGGLGVNAGMSFNNKTFVNYSKAYSTEKNNAYHANTEIFSETEEFKNKNGYLLSVNMPIGCSVHLSKTKNILNRIYLSYEVRPGYNQVYIPEVGMMGNSYLQHGGSIRVVID